MPRFVFVIASTLVFVLPNCTDTNNSAQPARYTPASVESQLTNGAPIYTQTCATGACHGTQGEGIRSATGFAAWPLVGADFQSRHPNAQIVFDVVRSGGEPKLRALTDQQIYDSIAYELSQNQITLTSPLTSANAFTTYGAAMSGQAQGGLFPPSDNAVLINMPFMRDLPIAAKNEGLQLQLDQIAQASLIGNAKPPAGGVFLILVIVFHDLSTEPIVVSPDHLSLSTISSELLKPQLINIHSAIERFHTQTIKPYYGTSALVVFTLSAPDQFDQLTYDDQAGNRLTLVLKP